MHLLGTSLRWWVAYYLPLLYALAVAANELHPNCRYCCWIAYSLPLLLLSSIGKKKLDILWIQSNFDPTSFEL